MSNALAIASVTLVLRSLVRDAIFAASGMTEVGSVDAIAVPPAQVNTATANSAKPLVNVFLYHLTPNQGWQASGLPSRDARGARLTNPPLALDLHYLLTAYGTKELEPEILLGFAMQALHDRPVLTRGDIERVVRPNPLPTLPGALTALTDSDLNDQIERIKVTPNPMSTEEMSRLWSAFQAPYRPSVAYHASVVLIDRADPVRATLPVLTLGPVVGPAGYERPRGVMVSATMRRPLPVIDGGVPPDGQAAARLGDTLTLHGDRLAGEAVSVRFTHARLHSTINLTLDPGQATPTTIAVPLPPDPTQPPWTTPPPTADPVLDPDTWPSGIYLVSATVQLPAETETRTTNEVAVALAPRIRSIAFTTAGPQVTFTVICGPRVHRAQQTALVVGSCEIAGLPLNGDIDAQLQFTCAATDLHHGPERQLVRLRVDGVDSLMVDRSGAVPAFDRSSEVVIP